MTSLSVGMAAFVGFIAGGVFVFFIRAARIAQLEERLNNLQSLLTAEQTLKEKLQSEFKLAALESLREVKTEAGEDIDSHKKEISSSVADMKAKIDECQRVIKEFELGRVKGAERLETSLSQIFQAEQSIRMETSALRRAFTTGSGVRGSLGEMVLQQILEENGMVKGSSFDTQVTLSGEAGNDSRPDFVIYLPDGKRLAIDSKEMAVEYLLAQETDDPEEKKQHLQKLIQNIRNNFMRLSRKEYQALLDPEVPYVVMFISNEAASREALSSDPTLWREALAKKVILASPMTIVPLLQLIKISWQQHQLANNARELGGVVEVLGDRLYAFVGHLKNFQDGLAKMNEHWRKAVGSWQARVAPQIEKAKSMGGMFKDTPELTEIDSDVDESKTEKISTP